ncbi:MAG: ABC-type transport auxiliary lipoprotein family protein [Gammaproteobacteria bacterium]|nr:ABC-type transport auxiliary lipoprotein family protein [Gammaproteobacteria bacterium]
MSRISLAATIAFVLSLAGCMTSPPAPTENFYRLRPGQTPTSVVPQLPVPVRVQRFTADGLLRERAMLYSEDAGHRVLKQHSYHFWMDTPARLLHDYWSARLQDANPTRVGRTRAANHALHGRLRRMERLLSDNRVDIALSIELSVRDDAAGSNILQRRYEVVEPAASDRVVDSVKAFETALQAVHAQFLADFGALSSHVFHAR